MTSEQEAELAQRRLRNAIACDGGEVRPLGDPEIAVEILRLRVAELEQAIRRLAEQDATLSVCEGNVTVTMDATLTDAEREAVDMAIDLLNGVEDVSAGASSRADAAAATLRGLLDRCATGSE